MSVARRISSASFATLFLLMEELDSSQLFGRTLGKQNGGVSLLQHTAEHILTQGGEQFVIVQAKAANEGVGTGELHELSGREAQKDIGHIGIETKAVHAGGIVVAQQALCQHEIRQVDFLDIAQSTVIRDGYDPIPLRLEPILKIIPGCFFT